MLSISETKLNPDLLDHSYRVSDRIFVSEACAAVLINHEHELSGKR